MEAKRTYNERWTEQEEIDLIHARIRMEPEFQLPKTKNHFKTCWDRVVQEANLDKPTHLVTNKWQNILKKYKKIVREQSRLDDDVYFTDWSSFREVHRFLKNKTRNKFVKGEPRISAEESTTGTDASISMGDLDNMNLSFDYNKFESNLITPNESEGVGVTYENNFETDRTNNHNDLDLTIVKNEMDGDPLPNESNDPLNKWNTGPDNIESNLTDKSSANSQNEQKFALRHMNQTTQISNEVTGDFNEDENSNYNMSRSVNRIRINNKRKAFRKPEYNSPKIFDFRTRFRPSRTPEEDEDHAFLISLLPSLKKLNDEQKLIVKTEFLKVLTRITYPNSVLSQNI